MRLSLLFVLTALSLRAGTGALTYSSYFGGNGDDIVHAMAVDGAGNVYLTGETYSSDFPVTAGAFQTKHAGVPGATSGLVSNSQPQPDAFVIKISPQGGIVYATYLGGANTDTGTGIAVDSAGNAWVVGTTSSDNFPIAGSPQFPAGTYTFITKISPDGSSLIYSALFAGGLYYAACVAVDLFGNVYLSNSTSAGPFIAKLNSAGRTIYSKSLGATNLDSASAITIDSQGNAYAIGTTLSSSFPITSGSIHADNIAVGTSAAWVVKLDPTGSNIIYAATIGGHGATTGAGIAVDSTGNAYITGGTSAADFPVSASAFQKTYSGGTDSFIAKLNADGSSLSYATFLGGSGSDSATGIALDSDNNAFVSGQTTSTDLPVSADAESKRFAGSPCLLTGASPFGNPPIVTTCSDAFAAKLNASGSALLYSTYLSGSNNDRAIAVALSSGAMYLAGTSQSDNFPTAGIAAADTRSPATCTVTNSPSSSQSSPCADGFLARIDFTGQSPAPPLRIVNFGNLLTTPISPAEVVTLFGGGIGPASPATLQLDSNGRIATSLSDMRVLFDGVASPLIRVDTNQITAIVPNAVSGKSHSSVTVERNGLPVVSTTVAIGAASPAFLTLNPSGAGQIAAINLDGTINGSSNPTAAGSILTLYAIGIRASGQPDGALATDPASISPAPVVVVGGQLAQVLYAGPSPTMTTALTQINIRLPVTLTGQLPVYIVAKGSSSQYGATISVH